jgi:metal-responsive CopG/Arc/MetJ family transcriptional regulator
MPRIPILRLGRTKEEMEPPFLTGYAPAISLEGLQLGIDNLRHDVHLSRKFVEQGRLQIARLIARHGNMEGPLAAEVSERERAQEQVRANYFVGQSPAPKTPTKPENGELKPLLIDLHTEALNRAKAAENLAVDLLARVAIIKFLRVELDAQFGQTLERCRRMLRNYEGMRVEKALEYRERVAAFQVSKKFILRKTGQELFHTLREIERGTLARMRRSLFGTRGEAAYKLFLNPLIFNEDGRDAYLNADHYVMLGNFDRDPDRFSNVRRVACEFLQSLDIGPEAGDEAVLDRWLNVPENAAELVGTGGPGEATPQKRSQQVRLEAWVEALERERLMDRVVASYEVVPLLAEYSPRINAQQLKNALISREEFERVEKLIEHGRLSPDNFYAAVERAASRRGGEERAKMAARFLRDFLRYHRDLRRLEALNEALDSANLIGNDKMRELSALNSTLYEFLLREEHKPVEEKVIRHVILKADVRDSSRLTRSLMERGLNPASYFSLNFYDPVNKLLAKYGACKVFLEGDAIILSMLERKGEPVLAVSRACVLAREMIEIVRGYNRLLERGGLPTLELGVGISFQDSAPMYLLDGEQRIMISDALNESDRLASCNKRARKKMSQRENPFNVYVFQTLGDADAAETPDDSVMNYNVNGIRMNEAAFRRLEHEISLEPCRLELPELWGSEGYRLHAGLVPVGNDIFRKIVVRASRIPQIDLSDFSLQRWTDRWYYEVCTNPAVYAPVEAKATAK